LALKLNMEAKGGPGAGAGAPAPIVSAVEGLPGGLLGPGISPQRGARLQPAGHSAGGKGFWFGLRRLSPLRRKTSEFSTRRSAIAVAMVVLYRMLPQSETAVFTAESSFMRIPRSVGAARCHLGAFSFRITGATTALR
jgi:hypothetical protein